MVGRAVEPHQEEDRERNLKGSPVRSSVWLLLNHAVAVGTGLFTTVWIARSLAPEDFAFYAYLLSGLGVAQVLMDQGLGARVIREIGRRPRREDRLLGALWQYRRRMGCWLAVGFILLSLSESEAPYMSAMCVLGAVFPFLGPSALAPRFAVSQRMGALCVLGVLGRAVFVAAVAIAAVRGWGVLGFAAALALRELINGRMPHWIARWERQPALRVQRDRFFPAVRRGAWLAGLSALCVQLMMVSDVPLLRWILPDEVAGVHAAAARVLVPWKILPGLLVGPFLPVWAAVYAQGGAVGLGRALQRPLWIIGGGAALAALVGSQILGAAGGAILGERYAASGPVFLLQGAGLAALGVGAVGTTALAAAGAYRRVLGLFCLGLLIQSLCLWLFSPVLQELSASLGFACAELFIAVGSLAALRKARLPMRIVAPVLGGVLAVAAWFLSALIARPF